MAKVFPPKSPVRLPLLEHNGVTIEPILHYGYSRDSKGRPGKERQLYGARDPITGERHWRSSYDEITGLIDNGFPVREDAP